MNPYESRTTSNADESNNSNSESLVADDSFKTLLILIIGAVSTVSMLVGLILGLYGLVLFAASIEGQGRFEGRATITISIAVVLIFCSVLFGWVGILGVRTSARRYSADNQAR